MTACFEYTTEQYAYMPLSWNWNDLFQLVKQKNTPCKSIVDFREVSWLWGGSFYFFFHMMTNKLVSWA